MLPYSLYSVLRSAPLFSVFCPPSCSLILCILSSVVLPYSLYSVLRRAPLFSVFCSPSCSLILSILFSVVLPYSLYSVLRRAPVFSVFCPPSCSLILCILFSVVLPYSLYSVLRRAPLFSVFCPPSCSLILCILFSVVLPYSLYSVLRRAPLFSVFCPPQGYIIRILCSPVVFYRGVWRAHHRRRGRTPLGDLPEGSRGGPRLYPDQGVGAGRVVPRDRHRRVEPDVSVQVAQQTQPTVHARRPDARRSGRRHRQRKSASLQCLRFNAVRVTRNQLFLYTFLICEFSTNHAQ